MRNNQPVTGSEYRIRNDQSLISRTDTKGNITYINRDFQEVSGFTEDELIGSPHNIVRHPDMPVEAFADMWSCLKGGHAWTGMVKNRRKNGDHYWVQANATPIWENGVIIGYTSVRTMPTKEQIDAAAQAYALFTAGKANGLAIRNGNVVRTGMIGALSRFRRLKIGGRINAVLAVLCMTMISVGSLGFVGMNNSNESLQRVYAAEIMPMAQMDRFIRILNRNEIEVLEAIASKDIEIAKVTPKDVYKNLKTAEETWATYTSNALVAEEDAIAKKLTTDFATYKKESLLPILSALDAGNIDEAKRLHDETSKKLFSPVRSSVDALLEQQLRQAKQEIQASSESFSNTRNAVISAIFLAIGFAIVMAIYLSRAIVRPLIAAVDIAKQIAACNLTAKINVNSNDETGQILHALNVMTASLSNIVAGVRRNAENIASGAAEIADGNLSLSSRTEQQASSLEETAASMEELTSTVKNNADNSINAKTLVNQSRDTAIEGGAAMEQVVKSMESITTSSKRITDIISVIDSIAFQTNILALNAAVEAARAGEQGRGFAVVATEVRNLAQRSAAAAKEIKGLIDESVAHIHAGSSEVAHARETMDTIVRSVKQVADIMNEISAASQEQTSGIQQVGQAVMQMDQMTQQNAALVEEAAAASESLQIKGAELMQGVGVFRLNASYSSPADGHVSMAQARPANEQPLKLPARAAQAKIR